MGVRKRQLTSIPILHNGGGYGWSVDIGCMWSRVYKSWEGESKASSGSESK